MLEINVPLGVVANCIFCNGTELTKEHVLPRWVAKRVWPETDGLGPLNLGMDRNKGELEDLTQVDAASAEARLVCKACNTGWMSRMENRVSKVLGPYLKREMPEEETSRLFRKFGKGDVVLRWMLKNALLSSYVLPNVARLQPTLQSLWKNFAKGGACPAGVTLELATAADCRVACGLTDRFWTINGDEAVASMMNGKQLTFQCVYQINHLLIRVALIVNAHAYYSEPGVAGWYPSHYGKDWYRPPPKGYRVVPKSDDPHPFYVTFHDVHHFTSALSLRTFEGCEGDNPKVARITPAGAPS